MTSEYLIFNAVIAGSVLVSALCCPRPYTVYLRHALLSVLLCAAPYLLWDVLVTDRHWNFNPRYVLAFKPFGLPPGEWLFFLTVPMATLFTWEMLYSGQEKVETRPLSFPTRLAAYAGLSLSVIAWVFGKEYTALALGALSCSVFADQKLRVGLYRDPRSLAMGLLVVLWTGIFNGYLTGRPVVRYDAQYQIDFRIGTIPIEDFVYGLSLLAFTLIAYRYSCRRWPRAMKVTSVQRRDELRRLCSPEAWVEKWVRKRLGSYKRVVVQNNPSLPQRASKAERVAVVGGGLAGMRAASILAERGYTVDLLEKAPYLGGKIGAWSVPGPDGQPFPIEHGFHAFFPHYYNTQHFLAQAKADGAMSRIEDYLIVGPDQEHYSYKKTHTTPLLNLFSLWRHGHYKISELVTRPQALRLIELLRYDPQSTFEAFDNTSYAQFAKSARIPPSLALTFNSFSRAFFAPPEKMSMAELIKSFHFFFLGQDGGLLYDYPKDNYQNCLIGPLQQYLSECGVRLHLQSPVHCVEPLAQGFVLSHKDPSGGLRSGNYDRVILACDVQGIRSIAANSPELCERAPHLHRQLARQPNTQAYAVWRLWLRGALAPERTQTLPEFIITDRQQVLDSVTFYDRFEPESRRWVQNCGHPACVLELHSYCVPPELASSQACKRALLEDLRGVFPELVDCQILAEHFALNEDFPAFFIGEHKQRPGVESSLPGLYLAGDWVSLPHPAMLMEAATMSGSLAANAILCDQGLAQSPIWSVPPRGLLAPSEKRRP